MAHIPLVRFIKIARRSGGIQAARLHHLLPWLLKHTLFEPLRWLELLFFSKKIQRHTIEKDPVFILGFYRTGTTYLQRLFVQDKKLGYQNVFQSALPELTLGFEYILKPVLSGITGLLRLNNQFHKIPFNWNFPGEEDVALTSFSYYESANWGNLFPRSFDQYYEKFVWGRADEAAVTAWKKNYVYWLKKLSIRNRGKRLVLKSPPHTARIDILLQLFPGAKFICIHRNPYDVFPSCRGFWNITNRHYAFQKMAAAETDAIILRSFNRTMNCYHALKEQIPAGQLFEITHEALVDDPFNRFKQLYESLGIGDFSKVEAGVKNYIAKTNDYPFTAYALPVQEQATVAATWGYHINYWEHLRKQGK